MQGFLKKYPLSCLTLLAVLYLSFFTPPEIPELEDIRLIDKWTHMVMYGGLTLMILYEHFKQHGMTGMKVSTIKAESLNWRLCRIIAFWFPFILGGIIEILQEYCTNHRRSGDYLDWIADGLGSLLIFVIICLWVNKSAKK